MSVEVTTFSPVAELLAVTVAPGISEVPDLTAPEIENVCEEEISCPNRHVDRSRKIAIFCTTRNRVPEPGHVGK
jgi:hypothetical protein